MTHDVSKKVTHRPNDQTNSGTTSPFPPAALPGERRYGVDLPAAVVGRGSVVHGEGQRPRAASGQAPGTLGICHGGGGGGGPF